MQELTLRSVSRVEIDVEDSYTSEFDMIFIDQVPEMFTKQYHTLDKKFPPFQPPKLPTATGRTRDNDILKFADEKFKQIVAMRKRIDEQYRDILSLEDGTHVTVSAFFEGWKNQIERRPKGAKHSNRKPFKLYYCTLETVELVTEVKPKRNQDDPEVIATQKKVNNFLKDCHAFVESADTIYEELQQQKSNVTTGLIYKEKSELVKGISRMCKYIQEFKEDIYSLLHEFTSGMRLSLRSSSV